MAEKIISQYNKLQSAFEAVSSLKINYACKALSNLSILKLFNSLGAGLDTVSVQEVQLGLRAGFDPSDIIFTPNGVSLDEIEQAMADGHISADEQERIDKLTRHLHLSTDEERLLLARLMSKHASQSKKGSG